MIKLTDHFRDEFGQQVVVESDGWVAIGFYESNIELSIDEKIEAVKFETAIFTTL